MGSEQIIRQSVTKNLIPQPPPGHVHIPKSIYSRKDITEGERDLFIKILVHEQEIGSFPTNDWLAEHSECSVRTIQRRMKRLIAKGYVVEGVKR